MGTASFFIDSTGKKGDGIIGEVVRIKTVHKNLGKNAISKLRSCYLKDHAFSREKNNRHHNSFYKILATGLV